MAKQKMSVSEKIRKQLAQGKSVKEISKYLKCSPALVYQVRAYDKKKDEKLWKSAAVTTSSKPVKTAKDYQKEMQQARLGGIIEVKNYTDPWADVRPTPPKRNVVQRFFNWICGD